MKTLHSAEIPRIAQYGETATPGVDMLNIEQIQSRSQQRHWEIDPHVHRGLYQVVWIERGGAEVLLDEHKPSVNAPTAIVVPPGVAHGFRFAEHTGGWVLTLTARLLVEGEFQSVGGVFQSLFAAPGVVLFEPETLVTDRLQALLRELEAEFALPDNTGSPVLAWLARSVVWRLAQARAHSPGGEGVRALRHEALFTRFLVLVETRYLEHWSLAQYASRLGMTSQRLNRLVRNERGCPALELIHERLTREACRRLVYTATPTANLANELGFEDPGYFSRFFKRRMGISPHQWRVANQLN